MPASLNSLSPEIIDLIACQLFILSIGGEPLAPYATISRAFQVAVERFTFGRVYVSGDDHRQLCAIGAHPWRRRVLRSLIYAVALPPYPSCRRYCKERREEHQANLGAFHEGVTTLWNELSTWKDKKPLLELQLGAQSHTDKYDSDDGWHEGCEEYRWLYPDHSLSIDSQKAALPTLDCVSSFIIDGGRRIHPTTLKDIFLTLPNLRELNLTLPSVHARYKASRAEYRADLAKALEAPTLQKLEILSLSMKEAAPGNHAFNIALAEDPSYPDGDVLSHAIRKLAQTSLHILNLDGPCMISPALWSSGQRDDADFPYLTELAVDMTIVTYDGRWYYTGDPAAIEAEELHSEDELEIGVGVESDSESANPERYDEEIDGERAAFFNGNIPYYPWRRNPDPAMYDPLVRSLAGAALRMPRLKYLSVTTHGSRGYKRDRDVDISLCSPGFSTEVVVRLGDITNEFKDWRWIVNLGLDVAWTLPADIQETMKRRVGEDGRVIIRKDGKVVS
ncbi:hypothetical protein ASPVEDRAFT_655563 [Aspergillus versicolor CBS 583.65]|uniref:F-box domain-containing protein n=1 Tax=Aspergillus versicolor CBS 583.65 TaxID=1036611 RepID=A0A1L9PKN0_ASPVE|nr:uncharacterized protein ASPVEDRAFT_655563 [Aspergillus versicolor CBS 583.65]OJJ02079.1 hypothetical protein ASPVEDRAFT_655563 [Aspergillus versicolor CBS 583.65]